MSDLLSNHTFHTVVAIIFFTVMLFLLKRISSFFMVLAGLGALTFGVLVLVLILAFAGVDRFQIPIDAPI
jgi:uncharacterized membrane protein